MVRTLYLKSDKGIEILGDSKIGSFSYFLNFKKSKSFQQVY